MFRPCWAIFRENNIDTNGMARRQLVLVNIVIRLQYSMRLRIFLLLHLPDF
jgi:hypothetical protein